MVLSVLQLTVVPLISLDSIQPDLLIIVIVIFTLRYGQLFGTIFGGIAGLFFDLISGGVIGAAMFSKTISSFIAGYFFNENKIQYNLSTLYFLVIVFITSSINSFFYLLITSSEIKLTASYLFLEQGILPGLYTSLISLSVVLFNQNKGS